MSHDGLTIRRMVPFGLVGLAAFTSSWTGLPPVLGLKGSDILLLVGTITYCAVPRSSARLVVPFWSTVPPLSVLVVIIGSTLVWGAAGDEAFGQLLRITFSMSVVAAVAYTLAVAEDGLPMMMLKIWTMGVAASSAAVVLNMLGISIPVYAQEPFGGASAERAIGLASHPNSLAFSIIAALPFVLYLWRSSAGWRRATWLGVFGLLGYALMMTDSRAGLAIALAEVLAFWVVWFGASIGSIVALVVFPVALWVWILPYLSARTRLAPGEGDLSDQIRTELIREGFQKFLKSPVLGAGFDEAIGTSMYVQLLSAGGLVLAAGYFWFVASLGRSLVASGRLVLSRVGIVGLAAILCFGAVQPGYAERATYWGVALAAAIGCRELDCAGISGPRSAARAGSA